MTIRRHHAILLVLLFAAAFTGRVVVAEDASVEIPQPELQTATMTEFKGQLSELRDLVSSCRNDALACDAAKVGPDDRVSEAGFNVHWDWLRTVLVTAKDKNAPNRSVLLEAAANRLEEQAREAGLPAAHTSAPEADAPVPFAHARKQADKVLAGPEFRKVTKSSYWDDLLARVGDWLDRMLGGVSSLGQHHRWLGPLVEWGSVALAMVALLVWVQRVMQQQRLAIRFEGTTKRPDWKDASRNWASLAQAAAERGDWRDAVHSLYWASVTQLEGRGVWRQHYARTPREYLRLLQTNAPQYRPLRQLTQALERIWYGLGQAGQADYDTALKLYEELKAA